MKRITVQRVLRYGQWMGHFATFWVDTWSDGTRTYHVSWAGPDGLMHTQTLNDGTTPRGWMAREEA